MTCHLLRRAFTLTLLHPCFIFFLGNSYLSSSCISASQMLKPLLISSAQEHNAPSFVPLPRGILDVVLLTSFNMIFLVLFSPEMGVPWGQQSWLISSWNFRRPLEYLMYIKWQTSISTKKLTFILSFGGWSILFFLSHWLWAWQYDFLSQCNVNRHDVNRGLKYSWVALRAELNQSKSLDLSFTHWRSIYKQEINAAALSHWASR